MSWLPGSSAHERVVYALYALTSFAMSFVTVGLVPVGPTFVQVADLLFFVTAGAWALAVLRGKLPLPARRLWAPALLLVAAAVVSLSRVPALKPSLVKLVGLCYLVTLGAVTASLASTRAGLVLALRSWFASGAVTGALGTLGVAMFYAGLRDRSVNPFLWSYGSIPTGSYPRVAVFFMNANMASSYLLVTIASAAMLLPLARSGRERAVLWVGAALMAVTSVFTLSAGLGGLALAVGFGWLVHARWTGRFLWWRELGLALGGTAAAAGLFVLSVFLLVPKGKGDLPLGPVDLSYETSGRVSVWVSAARTFAASPLRGDGIGTLVSETSHVRALNTTEQIEGGSQLSQKGRMEAHNVLLNVAGQLGLLGVVPFVWLLGALVAGAWPRSGQPRPLRDLRLVWAAWFGGAVLYHGIFGAFEDSRQYWFFFGIGAALAAANTLTNNGDEKGAAA